MSLTARWWLALALTGCTTPPTALVFTSSGASVAEAPAVADSSATPFTTLAPDLATDLAPTRDDVLALLNERVHCGRSPERCNFDLLAEPGSPYDRALRTLMNERIDFGLRTIAGEGAFRPTVTSIRLTEPGVAEVTTCVYDALVVYDTRTIPGAHIVFNDRAISIFSTWSIHLHEGRWKWFSEIVTRYAIERDAC